VSDLALEVWELSNVLARSDWSAELLVPMFGTLDREQPQHGLRKLHLRPRDPRYMYVQLESVEPDGRVGLVRAMLLAELTIPQLRVHLGEGHTPPPEAPFCDYRGPGEPDSPVTYFGITTFDRCPPHSSVRATFRDRGDAIWRVESVLWQPVRPPRRRTAPLTPTS
jgi:hypothetical protein